MFSFLRKESPSLQLYGKLPLAKDYLRIGAGDGAGRSLRDWLDSSFSGAAGSEAPSLPFAMRYLLDASSGSLMGCLWPSSDSGGLRPFPFSIFLERKRKAVLGDLETGLALSSSLWRKLDATHLAHCSVSDGQSYLEAMRAQTLDMESIEPARPQPLDFDAWLAALFGSEGRAGLERLFSGLRLLRPSTPRGPLRLPLVGNMPQVPQVVAWWKVVVQIGLAEDSQLPTLFFPDRAQNGKEPSWVLFFPRSLQPGDVRWLSSARDSSARGPGDFVAGRDAALASGAAAPESAAPLADSLRGALLTFNARG